MRLGASMLALSIVIGLQGACGHLTISKPAARNVISAWPGDPVNYCPHCQNAGGARIATIATPSTTSCKSCAHIDAHDDRL